MEAPLISAKDNRIKRPAINSSGEYPCIFQVVYPQDFNLQPPAKRGRPKKTATQEKQDIINDKVNDEFRAKESRTRSGRVVKCPANIANDYKKIDVTSTDELITVSDFSQKVESHKPNIEFKELQSKKRIIASQYICPKCSKCYLGKSRMIAHLKKNPEHGPLPEGFDEYNFDVWNYLFNITQKTKPGQRGTKFCEELSNLLHNVQLLKSALFKKTTDDKNCVQIDKVLGNAIGLSPGKYMFDENELYKDVTVLKLITNSDFFKPKNSDTGGENTKSKENSFEIEKPNKKLPDNIYADVTNSTVTEKAQDFAKKIDDDTILPADLLTDNLLLPTGDNTTHLLEISTSSDEVMNVDQFVNERFKKITEPDIELSNNSLNLDLPSLELFQFHTS